MFWKKNSKHYTEEVGGLWSHEKRSRSVSPRYMEELKVPSNLNNHLARSLDEIMSNHLAKGLNDIKGAVKSSFWRQKWKR